MIFVDSRKKNLRLVTSAEVLQELRHVCLPEERMETLDAAMALAVPGADKVIPITGEDVIPARSLADTHLQLGARDLVHLSVCKRHDIKKMMTFDRALGSVFTG